MLTKQIRAIMLISLSIPVGAHALDKQGIIPLPKAGIHVVPLANMDMPDEIKNEVKLKSAEQKKKGYFETESTAAEFLLNTPQRSVEELKRFNDSHNPDDTHLKADFNRIKLAFPFKGLTVINKSDLIGYAPIGAWADGWTGIKVFFKDDKSVCSYSYFGLPSSAAQLNQENVTKVVNGKLSYIDVEGNYNTGILYTVTWFEDNAMNVVDCANKVYDKSLTDNAVTLAQKIDKDLSVK